MFVELGNPSAVEHVDGTARRLPGQRTTRFNFPSGTDTAAAVGTVASAWSELTSAGDDGKIPPPAWVESDSRDLRNAVCKRFGIKVKDAKKPGDWGVE